MVKTKYSKQAKPCLFDNVNIALIRLIGKKNKFFLREADHTKCLNNLANHQFSLNQQHLRANLCEVKQSRNILIVKANTAI